ncbi:hypothetical protein GIB67_029279 [Kingdonia uniflora]|uniref:Uncharacterized protein n=1 Tax=Kingdonia uniflora TaxID=39325 RepID=A0A7J7N8T6_9MAGN|nr:hypothetical protein GIB67_029279 [Kingdonia uniflora]
MRKKGYCSKLHWGVPCAGKTSLQTDSRKNIEDILKTKLATINEDSEMFIEEEKQIKKRNIKRIRRGVKINHGPCSLTDSYVSFINRLASKSRL